MRTHLLLLAALLKLTDAGAASSALKWEAQELRLHALPDEESVAGLFKFINLGKTEVKILGVGTSCNCTTAELDRRNYAPGQAGELLVLFNVGSLSGTQRSSVQVQTDEAKDAIHTLNMEVQIPQPVRIQPQQLWWYAGEALTAKTIKIEFDHNQPVKILEVKSADRKFATELRVVEAGKKYDVIIRPTQALVAERSPIPVVITSDLPYTRHRLQTVYLGVAQRRHFGAMPVRLEPSAVWWRIGEKPASKTIRVLVSEKQELNFAEVEVIGDDFTAKLETIKPGKEYSLIVNPASTTKSSSALLQLKLDAKGDSVQKIRTLKRPVVAIAQVIEGEKGSADGSSNLGDGNGKP